MKSTRTATEVSPMPLPVPLDFQFALFSSVIGLAVLFFGIILIIQKIHQLNQIAAIFVVCGFMSTTVGVLIFSTPVIRQLFN